MRFISFSINSKQGLAIENANGQLNGLLEDDKNWPGDLDHITRSGNFAQAATVLSAGKVIESTNIGRVTL